MWGKLPLYLELEQFVLQTIKKIRRSPAITAQKHMPNIGSSFWGYRHCENKKTKNKCYNKNARGRQKHVWCCTSSPWKHAAQPSNTKHIHLHWILRSHWSLFERTPKTFKNNFQIIGFILEKMTPASDNHLSVMTQLKALGKEIMNHKYVVQQSYTFLVIMYWLAGMW